MRVAVSFPLQPIIDQLNAWTPLSVEVPDWSFTSNRALGIRYRFERKPFQWFLKDPVFQATSVVRYEAEACQRIKKPTPPQDYVCAPVASCGFAPYEPTREATVGLSYQWEWEGYAVRAVGQPVTRSLESRCIVTVSSEDLGAAATDSLMIALNGRVRPLAEFIAETSNARPPLDSLWRKLNTPIHTVGGRWLTLNPLGVSVQRGVRPAGDRAVGVFEFILMPVLSTFRPPSPPPGPMPPPSLAQPNATFSIVLDTTVSYQSILATLQREIRELTFPVGETSYRIDEVELATAANHVVVHFELDGGPIEAAAFLTTMYYDPIRGVLRFGDVYPLHSLGTDPEEADSLNQELTTALKGVNTLSLASVFFEREADVVQTLARTVGGLFEPLKLAQAAQPIPTKPKPDGLLVESRLSAVWSLTLNTGSGIR